MSERIAFTGTVTSEGRRLKGSVQLAGTRTFRNGEYVQVDPAALLKADASHAFASMEHDDRALLAGVPNGSLSITRHQDGFDWETTELPNTSYANDALELVRLGLVAGSSFEIDGLRSKFSTAEDGIRVRTYTGIKRMLSVSPVRDPAFPSVAAAFSKESEVTEQTAPVTPPEAPPAPAPVEAPASGKDGWEQFAKTLPTEAIEAGLKKLYADSAGDLSGEQLETYEGFAAELQARKSREAASRTRIEAIKFRHDAMVGNLRKAPEAGLTASDEYAHAFSKFLRGDAAAMEQFAQSIAGDGTQGGYGVPDGFRAIIIDTMKAYGGIQGIADSITTDSGQPLRWPTNDDTANSAAIASEGAAVGSGGADLVFGSVNLGAYSYDATGASNLPLLVSKELLQDWAVGDLEAYIGRKLGERLGRKMAADFATANGSGKPLGALAKTPDVMTATTAYAAFVEHFFQVDQAYRDGNSRWVMSDSVLTKIFNSLDDNGRPLFTPQSGAGGQGAPAGTILGKPVTLDQGAGTLVGFGDFRAGYIIRYVRGVQIDVDPYTNIKSRQIAYHAWARADANVQDSAAYSVSDYTSVSADS